MVESIWGNSTTARAEHALLDFDMSIEEMVLRIRSELREMILFKLLNLRLGYFELSWTIYWIVWFVLFYERNWDSCRDYKVLYTMHGWGDRNNSNKKW